MIGARAKCCRLRKRVRARDNVMGKGRDKGQELRLEFGF